MFLSMGSGIFKCWVSKEVKGPWGEEAGYRKESSQSRWDQLSHTNSIEPSKVSNKRQAFALKPGEAAEFKLRDEDTYISFREAK